MVGQVKCGVVSLTVERRARTHITLESVFYETQGAARTRAAANSCIKLLQTGCACILHTAASMNTEAVLVACTQAMRLLDMILLRDAATGKQHSALREELLGALERLSVTLPDSSDSCDLPSLEASSA